MKKQISRWSIFFAYTTVLLAAVLVWLLVPGHFQTKALGQQRTDEDIIFPQNSF